MKNLEILPGGTYVQLGCRVAPVDRVVFVRSLRSRYIRFKD